MLKLKVLLTAFFAGALSTDLAAQCEIGVLSEDAKFLVFNSDLELVDSGNLWWLGIRAIDSVVPGSTVAMAAVSSSRVVDVQDGSPLFDDGRSAPFRGVFVLPNLGRDYLYQQEVSYYEEGTESARWVTRLGARYLFRLRFENGYQRKSIEQYDTGLQLINNWETNESSAGLAICSSQEGFLVGGLDNKLLLGEARQSLSAISALDRESGYRLTDLADGCKVLAASTREPGDQTMPSAVVDLESGALLSEFIRDRYIKGVLFAEGTRLLLQELDVELVEANAVRTKSTNTFKVLDTRSGDILLENSPDIGAAELIGRLSCTPENSAGEVLLAGPDRLYLLDMESLTVSASQALPFGQYFLH